MPAPQLGPYIIARLVAGLPLGRAIGDIPHLPEPYGYIAANLFLVRPDTRQETLDFFLSQYPSEEARLRAAIASVDPNLPCPGVNLPADLPPDLLTPPEELYPSLPPEADLPHHPAPGTPSGSWLKDYLAFAQQVAPMADPHIHLAVGLFILAVAVARRVCLQVGVQRIYPNLYMLVVAPSAIHHKTTAFQVGLAVMKAAGLDQLLLPQRASPEALLSEMSASPPPNLSTFTPAERERWQAERQFAAQRGWLLDEASHLIETLGGETPGSFLTTMNALYDCPDREVIYTRTRGRQAVENAYLTFLGATTPTAIASALTADAPWNNGFWSRFALIIPLAASPAWQFFPPAQPIPQPLIDHLHHLAFEALPPDPSPRRCIVADASQCLTAWEAYAKATSYDMLLQNPPAQSPLPQGAPPAGSDPQAQPDPGPPLPYPIDPRLWASLSRLHVTAAKIATLLALSDWAALPPQDQPPAPILNLAHWSRAQSIVEWWRYNLHRLLALGPLAGSPAVTYSPPRPEQGQSPHAAPIDVPPGSPRRRHEATILRLLTRAGQRGLTLRELRQYSNLPHEDVIRQVHHLTTENVIEKYTPPGSRAEYYHLIPASELGP